MSPAGTGTWEYGPSEWGPYFKAYIGAALIIGGIVVLVLATAGGGAARVAQTAPQTLPSGPWRAFIADCMAAPSSEASCLCWASNLQNEAVDPSDADSSLRAAEEGSYQASPPGVYAVADNVSPNVALNAAGQGCDLFRGAQLTPGDQGVEDAAVGVWP
jgi:hypothetical protein